MRHLSLVTQLRALALSGVVLCLLMAGALASRPARADDTVLDGREGRNLALDSFRPQPVLKVDEHLLTRAKFPVVDVHTHPLRRLHGSQAALDDFVRMMDANNIAVAVSLDGGMGESFDEHRQFIWEKYRDRFVIYLNVDWRGGGDEDEPATWDCNRPDFVGRVVRQLEAAKQAGASGLKFFKSFGLVYRNADGSLIRIDDPRWDPIWEACGRLGLVVIMHTADPSAFFQPIDETNERWEELHRHPDWSFYGDDFPSRAELHEARNRVVQRHPNTTFIAAHMGNDAEDLGQTAEWLDRYPNLYVEFASRISELGRQPYTARRFLVTYADRVMFGTDGPWPAERLQSYWRFLETYDEYFDYSEKDFPPQGFWNIYGVGLPDDVLRKIYFANAARLIPGVAERLERYRQSHP
ncbi:MAG: amidohydrolase family protein [Pirellulales bacterium]|nr:amidohydrolase [Planctomycetales bacterium]